MKYIISERQYNLLIEQPTGLGPVGGYDYQKPKAIMKSFELTGLEPHTIMTIAAIGSAFIPVIGPLISAGIALGDAAMYYKEGDTKTAGMMAMFSLLPVIGPITSRIPSITKLGAKGMSSLSSKLSKGQKITDPIELQVINGIKTNVDLIKSSLDTHVKTLAQEAAKKPFSSVIKSGLLKLGKEGLKTLGLGVGYDVGYDFLNPQIDLNSISVDKVSDVNKKASQEIKYN
jgi:hypothetical protein